MNNGGSAFPEITSDQDNNGQYDTYSYGGMSLRDYFAGQALVGLVSRFSDKYIAEKAYQLADAMLEEREKNK